MPLADVPFEGGDTMSVLMAVNFTEPLRPRQLNAALPVEVETLLLKLLAKKPDGRCASAQEVGKKQHSPPPGDLIEWP